MSIPSDRVSPPPSPFSLSRSSGGPPTLWPVAQQSVVQSRARKVMASSEPEVLSVGSRRTAKSKCRG
ncbi:unnamed protein product [Macrosiphum euphorbiae]|uniref:Uncharacterized protein n=1 Tax=Macrosiphum euphorbiae TaxID=13131 RepID=A0AAV0WV59_9HEMI|nr:unnamed protein product [Macrosiphum euphorbiae]